MRKSSQIEATTAETKTKNQNEKMKLTAYKFTALQTPTWRTNLTVALIAKGFAAWEESDALYTDATLDEINWITGAKNYFAA